MLLRGRISILYVRSSLPATENSREKMKLLSVFVGAHLALSASTEKEMHPDTRTVVAKTWDQKEETTGNLYSPKMFSYKN